MTIVIADPAVAAGLLREGALVAFPTETVYGLGADATSDEAVARLFAAKGRPRFNPLIIHVASRAAAAEHGMFNPVAHQLAEAFWPGPLTLVVPRRDASPVSRLATAGLDSVGLRLPSHPVAQALLQLTGRPVAAPSANPSGRLSPTSADHVVGALGGRIAAVLDGGATAIGVEFDDRRLPRRRAGAAAAGRGAAGSARETARSPVAGNGGGPPAAHEFRANFQAIMRRARR